MANSQRPFLKSLEGVRAYAFLMVFTVHFSGLKWDLTGRAPVAYPWLILLQLSFVAVPIFFALSGYLITGILFDTQNRGGYFRVFYLRRMIRVFPLYYTIVVLGMIAALIGGFRLHQAHLLYLVYLHNWSPDESLRIWGKYIHVSHLWSMAVEEQFYLLWPVIIWILRGRRQLLLFCYTTVGVTFVLGLCYPLLHLRPFQVYESSLFRSNAIMLGAALALHERGPVQKLARLAKPALAIVVAGAIALMLRALTAGQALPYDRFGIAFIIPLLALMGAAVVVLAVQPGNPVFYLCERKWATELGKLSYSLYLLHEFLVPMWELKVVPTLSNHLGRGVGRVTGMGIAFAVLYAMSRFTYRFLEAPSMRVKGRFRYHEKWVHPEESFNSFLSKITI